VDTDTLLARIGGVLKAVERQGQVFEREIKKAETAILERVGTEMATQGYEIGRLRERADRMELDLRQLADNLREVGGTAKDNSRKMILAGSIIGVVLGTGGTLSVGDMMGLLRTPVEAQQAESYEVRASAVVDAAAHCKSDEDTTESAGTGRNPTVRCVNQWLAGPHASQFEIRVAREWAAGPRRQ